MRIHRDSGRIERVAEDDVGRLAANARQVYKLFQSGRNLPSVIAHDQFAAADDIPSFIPKEASGLDEVFQLSWIRVCEGLGIAVAGEQGWRHQIDSDVGTLRGENGSD